MRELSYDTLRYLAIRTWGWTPAEVDEIDYGELRALMMMHNAYEGTVAEQLRREQTRRRR